jgi:hypothetical protein
LKEGASKMRLGRTLRDYARLLSREVRSRRSPAGVV